MSLFQKLSDLFQNDDKDGIDSASDELNEKGEQRNWLIVIVCLTFLGGALYLYCLLYTSPSPRDRG